MDEKENKTVRVEIQKYKELNNILKDGKSILRLSLLVLAITVALFGGISIILVSLKSLYPYNDITTNVMGATSIRTEDKEVSYWLFNTAELWADSGIKVKAGETITIRASGKKHTAIHHLVEDAYNNNPTLREPWTGGEGIIKDRDDRDKFRAQFKIFDDFPQDALLMQVVPTGKTPDDRPNTHTDRQFVVIGKQAENIYIKDNGTLHFAINDIVLDDETIFNMVNAVAQKNPNAQLTKFTDTSIINSLKSERASIQYSDFVQKFGTQVDLFNETWKGKNNDIKDEKIKKALKFGSTATDSSRIELFGYFQEGNKKPWFEDNVGSFLIVVEKTR